MRHLPFLLVLVASLLVVVVSFGRNNSLTHTVLFYNNFISYRYIS